MTVNRTVSAETSFTSHPTYVIIIHKIADNELNGCES